MKVMADYTTVGDPFEEDGCRVSIVVPPNEMILPEVEFVDSDCGDPDCPDDHPPLALLRLYGVQPAEAVGFDLKPGETELMTIRGQVVLNMPVGSLCALAVVLSRVAADSAPNSMSDAIDWLDRCVASGCFVHREGD